MHITSYHGIQDNAPVHSSDENNAGMRARDHRHERIVEVSWKRHPWRRFLSGCRV